MNGSQLCLGYYVENLQPESVRCMKEEALYNSMVTEMTEGCIDYPSVKCGFIGEVGSVWPVTGTFITHFRFKVNRLSPVNFVVHYF